MTITEADIEAISRRIVPLDLSQRFEPAARDAMQSFYDFGAAEVGVVGNFSLTTAEVLSSLVTMSATHINGINQTTRRQVRRALADGVLAGEGERQIGRRVQAVFSQATRSRARTIARTETGFIQSAMRYQAWADSGVVDEKEWSSSRDRRVRPTHQKLEGQIRPLKGRFRIPGTNKTALHPHGFRELRENINCRCVALPRLSRGDQRQDAERDLPPGFVELEQATEETLAEAIREGFRAQQRKVLAVLE